MMSEVAKVFGRSLVAFPAGRKYGDVASRHYDTIWNDF